MNKLSININGVIYFEGDQIDYVKNGRAGSGKIYQYFSTGELRVNGLLVDFLDEIKHSN